MVVRARPQSGEGRLQPGRSGDDEHIDEGEFIREALDHSDLGLRLSHEVGHHVQTLLGISSQVQQAKARSSKSAANAIQVRMELQADCLAGVWANNAHQARNLLEEGDIEEGLAAAAAIGDDTLQRQAQGYVVPESFTHGSAQQRQDWFLRGWRTGEMAACDTFSGDV